jgi:hypothetical protein
MITGLKIKKITFEIVVGTLFNFKESFKELHELSLRNDFT